MISFIWKFCKCCLGKIYIVWCSKIFILNKVGLFNFYRGICILKNSSFLIIFYNVIYNFILKSINLFYVKIVYWKYKYKSILFYFKLILFYNFLLFVIKKWFMMIDFIKWFVVRNIFKFKVFLNFKIFV